MGRRGPPPTPTGILKIRGSWRAKTRGKEPAAEAGEPPVPASLGKIERKVWRALMETLGGMGILATSDGGQLERYCVFFVRWRQVEKEIEQLQKEHGDGVAWKVLASDDYRPALRGLWSESNRLNSALKQIENEFHLTPSARARAGMMSAIGDAAKEPKDGKGRFFAG